MTHAVINTHCPFSGKPVKDDSLTVYEGQTIGFCNPGCRDKFAAHPENYPQALALHFPNGRLHTYDARTFDHEKAWGNRHIASFEGRTSVKLHVTDEPYIWHVNNGQEVFVVLDGVVEMRYGRDGESYKSITLESGMIAHMEAGCEHVAHPVGKARILVIETLGSI